MDDPLIAINCLCYLQINNNNILIKCEKNEVIHEKYIPNRYFIIWRNPQFQTQFLPNYLPILGIENHLNWLETEYINFSNQAISNESNRKINSFKRQKIEFRNKIKKIREKNFKKVKNYFKKNYR